MEIKFIDYFPSEEVETSSQEVVKKSSQEDPIVMYLIVRESLNMSIGKTAAQCAHASQMLQIKYTELDWEIQSYFPLPHESVGYDYSNIPQNLKDRESIFTLWLKTSFRKVVLGADDKEWEKLKAVFTENHQKVIVVDAGLTEIAAGSETVIGLWPMQKSQAPKIVAKLQVLK